MLKPATLSHIPQMQIVRNAVTENTLSDPGLITDADCGLYLTERGTGWVWEHGGQVAGFSIVDLIGHNIWALFVKPEWEKQGIGRQLHDVMLHWYFARTQETVWLSTAPGTRAEGFYRKAGWREVGVYGKGELKFEMESEMWADLSGKMSSLQPPEKGL